jgi:hypothetical protein
MFIRYRERPLGERLAVGKKQHNKQQLHHFASGGFDELSHRPFPLMQSSITKNATRQ